MYGMQRRVDEMQGADVAVTDARPQWLRMLLLQQCGEFLHRKGLLACAAGWWPMRLEQQGRWQAGWC